MLRTLREKGLGHINAWAVREKGHDVELLVSLPVPFLVGGSTFVEDLEEILTKLLNLLGVPHAFARLRANGRAARGLQLPT